MGRHHRTATFAGPLGARASRQASAAPFRAVTFQTVMAIDRECKRSGMPVNDCGRTTEIVGRVEVKFVLCIEALLARVVWVSCRTRCS